MAKPLSSASDVIDALGGTVATAELCRKSPQAVTNWRASGRLPPDTYLILTTRLRGRRLTAPPRLWGIREPSEARA